MDDEKVLGNVAITRAGGRTLFKGLSSFQWRLTWTVAVLLVLICVAASFLGIFPWAIATAIVAGIFLVPWIQLADAVEWGPYLDERTREVEVWTEESRSYRETPKRMLRVGRRELEVTDVVDVVLKRSPTPKEENRALQRPDSFNVYLVLKDVIVVIDSYPGRDAMMALAANLRRELDLPESEETDVKDIAPTLGRGLGALSIFGFIVGILLVSVAISFFFVTGVDAGPPWLAALGVSVFTAAFNLGLPALIGRVGHRTGRFRAREEFGLDL